jgi:nucleoside-diphosphate-sugar epimerase
MEKKKRILVTGGKGFLGSILIKNLRQLGHEVESYDLVDGNDLLDRDKLKNAVQGKDAVFHLAAVADLNISREDPLKNMDINVLGTINVAEACWKANATLYFASTCCAYGNQEIHPSDEKSLPNPTEIYACSKLAGENIILGYAKTCGLEYNIMRLATFYGPEMRPALAIHVFLAQALKNQPITVHGDGSQTRTLTYINDIVSGMVSLFNSGVKNEIVNITTEEEVSVLDMVKTVKEVTKSKSDIVFIPQRPGQILKEQLLAGKAKRLFGWQAKTSFREGVEKSYEWIKTKDF